MPTLKLFWRMSWVRTRLIATMHTIGRPTGTYELHRKAGIPDAFVAYGLLQLEIRELVIREKNPTRKGFLWSLR